MRIGVLKEIKSKEHRVAVTPEGVEQMRERGHEVFVEIDAGDGSDFHNQDYEKAGATICRSPKEIYQKSEMIM
ncbi:MAG: alanine dehydrogenase, partial [Deltaproteobacteria bacterium]|nr:alanine dehydrogenase [Deltaproteobacteria bacterium]